MIVIYRYDASTKKLTGTDVVVDDYGLQANETTVVCPDGLYEPSFDEAAQTWKGITKEEWEAKHPRKPVEPSADAKVMNTMGIQIANLTKQNQSLSQTVNALGLQIAKMQDTKTTNGGN